MIILETDKRNPVLKRDVLQGKRKDLDVCKGRRLSVKFTES